MKKESDRFASERARKAVEYLNKRGTPRSLVAVAVGIIILYIIYNII